MKINPTQLKSLRIQSGLSCEQLAENAGLSVQQISDIESSNTEVDIARYKARRLARVLGVELETLEPSQSDGTAGNTHRINPECLTELRKRKNLSRRELAEKSGISARQIVRLETSDALTPVRPTTLKKLAGALGVDGEMLTGSLKHLDPEPEYHSQDIQLSNKISSQVRLAYDLVKLRYGASQKDIINLAPLLFVLLAEGSLAWRRQYLQEVEETMERLKAFGEERKHLYFTYQQANLELGLEAEAESIEAGDLRGDTLRNRDDDNLMFDVEALYEVAPFADYLIKLSEDLGISGIVDFGSGVTDDPWGTEPYQLFRNGLDKITGGSEQALWALEYGDVRLSEIPKELLSDEATDSRIKWLENKLSDKTRQIIEKHKQLEIVSLDDFIKETHSEKSD